MHITRLKLWNFRRFGSDSDFDLEKPSLDLPLQMGLNVLIGENDSGKTAIIDAIRFVLGTHSIDWNRVSHDDFHNNVDRLRIEIHFAGFSDDEAKNFIEWLSWEGKDENENIKVGLRVNCDVRRTSERVLPYEIRAGADDDGVRLSAEAQDYLKCAYLRPLRDAGAELVPKRNSRLSRIFMGHHAFKGKDNDHYLVNLFARFNDEIKSYFDGIDVDGKALTDEQGKKLKKEIDSFIQSFYSQDAKGLIEVYEGSLKSILERLILSIADEFNPGLGTLNRLFMAAELVHLSKPDWHGLRMGLIEELEAHLHPQAQMKIIEKLQNRKDIQLILTSHSPNLASKVKLENLIVCDGRSAFPMGAQYTKLEPDDYKFLECFLDVTKSNLFFAKGVIMVEGWAEELIIPALAKKMKASGIIDQDLTDAGVSVVNVGGIAFSRYDKIFLRKAGSSMSIPVSIITDVDVPEYEKNGEEYIARNATDFQESKTAKIAEKRAQFDNALVKGFIAPHWTLEYSLFKSVSLGTTFTEAFKKAHPQVDAQVFEKELGKKLLNKGLKKQRIAYRIAEALSLDISGDNSITLTEDREPIQYLLDAIKHACGYSV